MSGFKLIAIDMDGTLLNNDLQISLRAQEAIRQAREQEVHVTLCTGRMYASALPYAEQMGLALPLVTYNGAYVKHSGTGEILYSRNLPKEHAQKAFLKAKAHGFHVNVYYQDRLYVEQLTERGKIYARTVRVPVHLVDNMLEFLQEDPIKIVVLAEPGPLKVLENELLEEMGDKIYVTKSSSTFLEILHPEATKGRGLQAVARYLDIPRHTIMGIGDSYNDLEMFKFAGFAVVMDNAEPDIKDYADYITCCNDDDGVAEAIEKLILSKTDGREC